MELEPIPLTQAIPEDLLELWLERASIMEFDGGLSRADAEWQAFLLCIVGDKSTEGTAPGLAA